MRFVPIAHSFAFTKCPTRKKEPKLLFLNNYFINKWNTVNYCLYMSTDEDSCIFIGLMRFLKSLRILCVYPLKHRITHNSWHRLTQISWIHHGLNVTYNLCNI